MTMPTVLDKRHATVHTAAIDVKIMRLDKKQVTLSVFRQLDEELIFNADGTLRGTPWGRVNYTWKGNKNGTVFHVVWQDGDKLKRSPVPKPNTRAVDDWVLGTEIEEGLAAVHEARDAYYEWLDLLGTDSPEEVITLPRIDLGYYHADQNSTDSYIRRMGKEQRTLIYRWARFAGLSDEAIEDYPSWRELAEFLSEHLVDSDFCDRLMSQAPRVLMKKLVKGGWGVINRGKFAFSPLGDDDTHCKAISAILHEHTRNLQELYELEDERLTSLFEQFQQHVEEMGLLDQLFIAV